MKNLVRWTAFGGFMAVLGVACAPVKAPGDDWPAQSKEWYERSRVSFRTLDTDGAEEAIVRALKLAPMRPEVRVLGAQIALARLDYDTTLERVQGVESPAAKAVRGRALWYSGKIGEAAEELDRLLADPSVHDSWASGVVSLARSGNGRQPFSITGDRVAVVDMQRFADLRMVVPVELNGQPTLALVSTGTSEVVIDSAGSREPSWVSLRFGERLEVKDVPALTDDLSGLSRELNGAPIKVLLGAHLLRHLNVTFDFLGRQFVARTYDPPPPPVATKLPVQYVRGGGMVVRGRIGEADSAPEFTFLVDTSSSFPLALDESAWSRSHIDPNKSHAIPGKAGLLQSEVSSLRLGAYPLPAVPVVNSASLSEMEKGLEVELDGRLGSPVLGAFRVTLAEGGLTMWLEDAPPQERAEDQGAEAPAAPQAPALTPPSPAGPASAG
ncbi:MAG TPA: hypothetical protein VHM70_28955 [Polyangiaceae bacterium]|nr:hypothetical protein [Polyangiaceae bacterium]